MRYPLDIEDRAIVYSIGSVTEDNPTFRFFLDEDVDPERLGEAVSEAFKACPYLKTRLVFDGIYCLEDNPGDFVIHTCRFEDRPLHSGAFPNGYLFQLSCFRNELVFDWTHIPTDGLGMLLFMKTVLTAYFGLGTPAFDPEIYTRLNLENHYDSCAGRAFGKPQAAGFDPDRIPHSNSVGRCSCTILTVPLERILSYGKRVEASPAAIVPALVARTFRKRLDGSGNVRGKIVATTRKILGTSTMHNSYMNTFVTYTDAFDKYDFSTVCSLYRSIIDVALVEENVLHDIKIRKEALKKLEDNPDPAAAAAEVRESAVTERKTLCNFNFSYIGELPFPKEIKEHLTDFQGICVNDNSEFGILAYATDGQFYIQISENYADRSIIDEFVSVSTELGVPFTKITEYEYRQAFFSLNER